MSPLPSDPQVQQTLSATPSPETLAVLASLQEAVAQALERKRRLGQYSVQWSPQGPVFSGPDAPVDSEAPAPIGQG